MSKSLPPDFGPLPAEPLTIEQAMERMKGVGVFTEMMDALMAIGPTGRRMMDGMQILIGGVIHIAEVQPEEMRPRLDSFAIYVAALKALVNELDVAVRR